MIAIVSAFRGVSTKADQAHIPFVSGSISMVAGARSVPTVNSLIEFRFEVTV